VGDTPSTCWTCGLYRPDTAPRIPNYPPVCDGDRALMDKHLVDVANLTSDLSNAEPALVDRRRYERFDRNGDSLGKVWSDPLAVFGGVAPINSRSKQPSVSGSRERPIPIPVAALDLKAPAKVPSVAPSTRGRDEPAYGWPEDQIGHLSTATVLDRWVRDWRAALFPDQHLPKATVDELVSWLRNRLQDACDQHPAIVVFAEDIRTLRSALRQAAGETDSPPEPCEGVSCRRCSMMTLYRQAGGDVACINPDCQAVLREDEYLDWVKTLAAEAKIRRHAEVKA
jgi:hypothetical protein